LAFRPKPIWCFINQWLEFFHVIHVYKME
jgi:hypothetical protein